jgi:N-acetylglucosaminyl-diphospho-decaprenol L-rhamnosyltransferase
VSPAAPLQGAGAPPSVQVVIVSYESCEALLACLASLARHVRLPLEVTVVDNASRDGSAEAVRTRHPAAQLLVNSRNEGFAAACNRGWRAGHADFVLFLNPDAEVTPGAVETLAACLLARPEIAVVGPLTRGGDGSIQVSTGPDLTPWTELAQRRLVKGVERRDPALLAEAERRHAREHEPAWVSGACLMARRQSLVAVGGFDEGFFLYEEDADLCRRVRASGARVLFTPAAEIHHRLGVSMAREPQRSRLAYHASHLRYYRKHNALWAQIALRTRIALRGLSALLRGGEAARTEAVTLLALAFRDA